MKKVKKVKNEKKPFIKTRTKMDNSIEIELQKSPAKTFFGKVLIFLIAVGTLLVPLGLLIYVIIDALK